MSQRLVKPASSAARATAASSAAVAAGCPGQSKRETCRPKRSVIGSSCWRSAASGAVRKAGGTSVTGPARWTPANPSAASASPAAKASASRTWPATTFAGTGLARSRLRRRTTAAGGSNTTAWAGTPWRSATRAPRVAATALEAGRVDDRRQPAPQAPLDDEVEDVEGVLARADVALAGADDGAQAVGRDDLVGVEPVGRPVRLAGRRRAHEDDEARVRQAQRRPVERRLGHPAFSGPRPDRGPPGHALPARP